MFIYEATSVQMSYKTKLSRSKTQPDREKETFKNKVEQQRDKSGLV